MNKDALSELVEAEIVIFDDEGLPVKKKGSTIRKYNPNEVIAIILPYIYEDITISSREIARRANIDPRTVNKTRKSQEFKNQLAELTNDKLLDLRCLALDELENILKDKSVNKNIKIKAIHEVLIHSVSVAELAIQSGREVPKVSVNDLIKELEQMDD